MKKYELMIIVKASLSEASAKEIATQVQELTTSLDGSVEKQDFWGKRKFAYQIKHDTEGYYMVLNIQLDPAMLDKFKQKMNLISDIVRYLVTVK